MKSGYIALWRKIREHPFYKEPREFSKYEAWVDLLMEAQHKKEPQEVIFGMNTIVCNYGESLKSIKTWSHRWNWSRSKVFRFLKLLQKMNQIRFKSETITTRIKVINYGIYDPKRNADETQMKRNRTPIEHQSNTDKNVKNVKNVKKKSKKEKRIPPDLSTVTDYFQQKDYPADLAKRFFDYYSNGNPPWTDSQGNPIRSWKQKAIAVWLKPKNKRSGGNGRSSTAFERSRDSALHQARMIRAIREKEEACDEADISDGNGGVREIESIDANSS